MPLLSSTRGASPQAQNSPLLGSQRETTGPRMGLDRTEKSEDFP